MYNAERYMKRLIDSVLAQTFSDFEFILVDDCSSDTTVNVVKSYQDQRIIVIELERNVKQGYARNIGIE